MESTGERTNRLSKSVEDIDFFFNTIEGYYMLTLKSDTKSAYLLSQPYLCNVNTITQNDRVGMKAGCCSRKKETFPFIRQLCVFL